LPLKDNELFPRPVVRAGPSSCYTPEPSRFVFESKDTRAIRREQQNGVPRTDDIQVGQAFAALGVPETDGLIRAGSDRGGEALPAVGADQGGDRALKPGGDEFLPGRDVVNANGRWLVVARNTPVAPAEYVPGKGILLDDEHAPAVRSEGRAQDMV